MNDLSARIEQYLLETRDWVDTDVLCARFLITERQLRGIHDQPGLVSNFAISRPGQGGFKHASLATQTEYLRWKHCLRKHAIKELVRVAAVDRRRHTLTRTVATHIFEKHSGQELMPFACSGG